MPKNSSYEEINSCINTEFYRAKRYDRPLSIILFDLSRKGDGKLSDENLNLITSNCRSLLRQSDIFGKIDQSVFAIILPETLIYDAEELADRMCELVAVIEMQIKDATISVGFGVTTVSVGDSTVNDFLKRAEYALVDAKKHGSNTVRTRHIEPVRSVGQESRTRH